MTLTAVRQLLLRRCRAHWEQNVFHLNSLISCFHVSSFVLLQYFLLCYQHSLCLSKGSLTLTIVSSPTPNLLYFNLLLACQFKMLSSVPLLLLPHGANLIHKLRKTFLRAKLWNTCCNNYQVFCCLLQ